MARIVLTVFGSLGDLHPFLAVGLELRRRGHHVVVATSAGYRAKVEALDLGFHPVRPDNMRVEGEPGTAARMVGGVSAPLDHFFATLRETLEDTRAAARGADLLVAHHAALTASLVSELDGIPWASVALMPLVFFSVHDPPVLVGASAFAFLRSLPRPLYRAYFKLVKWAIRPAGNRVRRLRAELGLGPGLDPLFEGLHSPELVLALYSSVLGRPQPDWPANTRVTGFCFHDQGASQGLSPELGRFLEAGPPPLVFTLGSWAAWNAGSFYAEAAEAARLLGRRAVLVTGGASCTLPATLPEGVARFDYERFSELFPRAAAVVHPGGIGTTGLALLAGRPMLAVPFVYDQPDNADRIARFGLGRAISRRSFTAKNVARSLSALLADESVRETAARAGEQVRSEDGPKAASDAIEELLAKRARGSR